ncbi:MAG TPA: tripartite tricarboxylate transporter substrate binding protein [Casimicrobiaceae bacterium]|nr:tripartite tricarboxylate transporter substrate binding protein [Casimicrobiaceae bacterium]
MWKAIVLLAAAVGVATSLPARADYPDHAIRLVVPYPTGAGTDSSARIVADALSRRLGQQVVVDNKPGASGTIGVDYVAKSAPDGYTLLWTSIDSITLVPALKGPKLPYRVPEDLAFIGKFCETGMALVASSKLPVNNLAEFIAYAKANPGKINYGSSGVGGAPHLGTLLLAKYSDIKLTHVPYKGIAPAMNDLLGGQIDFALLTPVTIVPQLGSDKIKVLGITAPARHPMVPNAPTVRELGLAQATVTVWYGMMAPAKTPAPILERLRSELLAVAQSPEVKEKLAAAGLELTPVMGDAFEKAVVDEIAQWRSIIQSEGIVAED